MNSSALVLLGAFDVLIVLIQTQRQIFDNCVNTEATIQTLHRIKNEYAEQLLAFTRAQAHASEAFRSTLDQLLAALPQGSDLEPVLRSLQLTLFAFMGSGPTPPWPSSSSSSSPLGFDQGGFASHFASLLRQAVEQRPSAR